MSRRPFGKTTCSTGIGSTRERNACRRALRCSDCARFSSLSSRCEFSATLTARACQRDSKLKDAPTRSGTPTPAAEVFKERETRTPTSLPGRGAKGAWTRVICSTRRRSPRCRQKAAAMTRFESVVPVPPSAPTAGNCAEPGSGDTVSAATVWKLLRTNAHHIRASTCRPFSL